MSEQEQEDYSGRRVPTNNLDFSFMTIDPAWGKEATQELHSLLIESGEITKDDSGKEVIVEDRHLWGILNYFTRDLRLGNLNNELYLRALRYIDLAGDCISRNLIKGFLASLRRVISILELSQSRGGFLRRRSNTFTQENFESPLEPKKKTFFGNKRGSD